MSEDGQVPHDPLTEFSPATREWFGAAFPEPTQAQLGAWAAISAGRNALVVAPTGSGKTLSAFLWAIDRLLTSETAEEQHRCRVLYVSPLKALAVDVERNLRAPLVGIRQTGVRLGEKLPELSVGIRSGDTPAAERRRLAQKPPDILITTPESLFLLLTSSARESLRGVETVILDEVHAVAGTKRGAHLGLSLERLDALLPRPAQRIGLSATVRPVEEVARFLGGQHPVEVVAPVSTKAWDLQVVVPVEDMTTPGAQRSAGAAADDAEPADLDGATGEIDRATGEIVSGEDDDWFGTPPSDRASTSLWPHVEEAVADLVEAHRSTIVFANSRRLAERLTARLNEIAADRAEAAARRSATGSASAVTNAPGQPAQSVPAQIMAQSGSSEGAPPILAKAHHGSVSKEQRALIEEDLKLGRLPAVVATSSLELGIDMGSVDLVVQIESPPSVASALQRVGRAGHQVGEVSRGVLFPKHRGDLAPTAVAVAQMLSGRIESLRVPANPLDVLAQQIVAATAMDPWDVDELYGLMKRAASYAALPRAAFDATLDLLAGSYPSDEFAELRPRVVWDRVTGQVAARPGAQRLAVTSGGTIPDRGLFGVFLAGEGTGRRVGELDEEMVYESRVGDVFALGATSWRIQDITHDRVIVTPAPGVPGRLPFWKGDSLGRPAELGAAIGSFTRRLVGLPPEEARREAEDLGLNPWAADNLLDYLTEQRAATSTLPSDATLIVERFRDELGDWRLVVHSPYGIPVHAPWALAINARLRERYGVDGQAMASDDGIVIRIPDSDAEPPGGDLIVFEPEEVEDLVTQEVGGSALFAARFRECAARALLLPRRDPGRRSPLWQQRQRSAQLLEVAAKYPSFPIVLEAVRECLQDVYDLPALVELLGAVARREVSVLDVATTSPSPYARTLLFGYVAQFLYEGDSPIAERRAAALSLDQGLLAELLGRAELRELLDPEVLAEVESELQRTHPERRARDAEGLADLLRILGPLSPAEITERAVTEAPVAEWIDHLRDSRRIALVSLAGVPRWAVVEDLARLRDGLGVPMPPGIPTAFTEPVTDPLGDLIGRFARTHGPFTEAEVAHRLGLGVSVVAMTLHRLASSGRVLEGEFRPAGGPGFVAGSEWCDAEVLRRLRRRSLARLRQEVEPVDPEVLGRFLPSWQHVIGSSPRAGLRGLDGVVSAVEQLAGAPVPASAWETLVLPSRVRDYEPAMLDELMASGEVLWAGHGALPGSDGWISLHLAEGAELTLPPPRVEAEVGSLTDALLDVLAPGGGWFFRQLVDQVGLTAPTPPDEASVAAALWELSWSSVITGDTFAPVRALVGTGPSAHRAPRAPARSRRPARQRLPARLSGGRLPPRSAPPQVIGRWSMLPGVEADPTRRAHALAELLLDRHGVVTRGAVTCEGTPGGFASIYRVLSGFEEAGRCRRGYFVAGLGAAQFGTPGSVDRLRTFVTPTDGTPHALVLAATDPANPFGAALPWPRRTSEDEGGHRPGRKAGAVVVLVDGRLVIYLERGGKTLLSWSEEPSLLVPAADALAEAVRRGALGGLTVERADGEPLLNSGLTPVRAALQDAGFLTTPKGLRLRG